MAFSDEQFNKLWELVIRIDENTKNQSKIIDNHMKEDISNMAISNKSVEAVHGRLDRIKNDLDLKDKAIRTEWDRAIGFQNKLMGAIAVLVFVVPIVVSFVKK